MKDNKTTRIELRTTPTEKEQIKAFAEKHDMTISELLRSLLYKAMKQEDK